MNLSEFKEAIFRALLETQGLVPPPERRGLGPTGEAEVPEEVSRTRQMMEQLIAEAFKNGFPEPPEFRLEATELFGGAVAQYVGQASSSMDFAFKRDMSPDLAKQAATLRELRDGGIIPPQFRPLFPRIYAALVEGPPFAYLMEFFGEGYTELSDHLFLGKTPLPADLVVGNLAETLFGLYGSTKQDLLVPNPEAIYVRRVRDRLHVAERLNPSFGRLTQTRTSINSQVYESHEVYLEEVVKDLPTFRVPFSTFVHGDIHPGNIFFKLRDGSIDFKFIDPKSWIWGDYMFDVGKLLHYIMVTGPREDAKSVEMKIADGDPVTIDYEIPPSPLAEGSAKLLGERLCDFASAHNDLNYRARLDLSLASNLLGLCENRLTKDAYEGAVLYYCEGLRYLRQAGHRERTA